MQQSLIIALLLTMFQTFSFGQAATDSLTLKNKSGSYIFYQGTTPLNFYEATNLMATNEEAHQLMQSTHSTTATASVFSYAGGFLIGWPIGTAIGGGDPNWGVAGGGAVLALIGIAINSGVKKKVAKAVDVYNTGLRSFPTSPPQQKTEVHLSTTSNGLGLMLFF